MENVLLIIHLAIAVTLVGVVLFQHSEGGGLGMGGGSSSSGGLGGFLTGRSAANLITRTTAVLAGLFFTSSILLTLVAQKDLKPGSELEQLGGLDEKKQSEDGLKEANKTPPKQKGGILDKLEQEGPRVPQSR